VDEPNQATGGAVTSGPSRTEFDPFAAIRHQQRMAEPIGQFGSARERLRETYADAASRRPLTGRSDTETYVFLCLADLIDALAVTRARFDALNGAVGTCAKIATTADDNGAQMAAQCRLQF
jgi:hypothetical protein